MILATNSLHKGERGPARSMNRNQVSRRGLSPTGEARVPDRGHLRDAVDRGLFYPHALTSVGDG